MGGFAASPPNARAVHLCIDMQLIFAPGAVWSTPWTAAVMPQVLAIARRFPERTIFTRFIPPEHAEQMPGAWQQFYRRWSEVTRDRIDPALLHLYPALEELAPPAEIVDRPTYSAFASRRLRASLERRQADTLIVTGAETDMCVLASVLGAIDRGYRVILISDGVCSSSDQCHDAVMKVYRDRFSQQVEVVDAERLLSAWQA